jgi:hypothetical protein
VIRAGSRRVAPVAPGKVVDCKDAYLNASPENWAIFGAFLCAGSTIDSAASSRRWLSQRPHDGQHARPARRTVPSCTRRAGLFASRNLAFGPPHPRCANARSALVDAPSPRAAASRLHLSSPRDGLSIPDRPSRETSKTGLRPVGRAAVAAFETGLRPVRTRTYRKRCARPARPARAATRFWLHVAARASWPPETWLSASSLPLRRRTLRRPLLRRSPWSHPVDNPPLFTSRWPLDLPKGHRARRQRRAFGP